MSDCQIRSAQGLIPISIKFLMSNLFGFFLFLTFITLSRSLISLILCICFSNNLDSRVYGNPQMCCMYRSGGALQITLSEKPTTHVIVIPCLTSFVRTGNHDSVSRGHYIIAGYPELNTARAVRAAFFASEKDS